MKLGRKLWLAGVSGGLVALVWINLVNVDTLIGHGALYSLCGGLFMAGVLLPYLKRRDLFSWRSAGLVLAGSVSFNCATYGGEFGTVESWDAFFERALPPAGGQWRPPE
jgi:hypothetical protein